MDELRQTTERLAIQRLIAVYAQLIDSGRLDDSGQLFTEDALRAPIRPNLSST